MGRRCPSCNKFPPVEQGDPELNLNDPRGDEKGGTVEGECRLVLTSGCCGDEIAESAQSFEIEFDHPVTDKHEVCVDGESADPTDRFDGKEGTPFRYRRHYYGAEISLNLKCSCGWEGTVNTTVEEMASCFDDCF